MQMRLKKIIEYVVNELDADGEIVDVSPHDTSAEARRTAAYISGLGKPFHTEKVTRWWDLETGNLERQIEEDVALKT